MCVKVTPYIDNRFGDKFGIYSIHPEDIGNKLFSEAQKLNIKNIHLIGNKKYFEEIKNLMVKNNQSYSNINIEVY